MMGNGVFAGLERLRAHFPTLATPGGSAAVLAAALGVFGATTGFFLLVDRYFVEWMPDGEIVVLALGFLILSRFFSQKDRYVARFGRRAYARAFTSFGIPGLGIVFGAIGHLGYMPGPLVPDIWWKPVLVGFGWLTLLVGTLLWWRAVNALGVDYLTMLYVYHPEDRRVVRSGLFGVVRHPVYAAAVHISTGLACVHASWYGLLVALVIPLFFLGWIFLVEEKELLRNAPAYMGYRRSVPALLPRHSRPGRVLARAVNGRVTPLDVGNQERGPGRPETLRLHPGMIQTQRR